jgi:gliding motility-associated-like protein
MNRITLSVIFYLFLFPEMLFAQKGKNGQLTVSSGIIVNEYTTLSANAAAGSFTITVANSNLNLHGRFSSPLSAGDLLMIIQMQGASINGRPDSADPAVSIPNDSSWGAIVNYNNCGNYEFREVSSVPNDTTVILTCALANNYTDSGKVQVVRTPRYSSLTINDGGVITCDPWDSADGGIVAIEDSGNTIIDSGGSINANALGFRGGQLTNMGYTNNIVDFTSSTCCNVGALKGEGIAGYKSDYNKFGGMFCRGAAANAGGGGNSTNDGGGGGSNGGIPADWINGDGNPDISNPNYITAWNLEYTWFSTFVSSGGGRGGYTWSLTSSDPLTTPPGDAVWGDDSRRSVGGLGGRPLDYSTGKLFFGGGGGAGQENNSDGGAGGNGGGMIYLISYGTVSGNGLVISNGHNGGADSLYPGDGPGGAGGGGTIVINSTGNISGITLEANGGTGGNQDKPIEDEAEGPGGGGGGGYIATTNSITEQVNAGANGITISYPTFPADGATKGSVGTIFDSLTNFIIIANDDTICRDTSVTLYASLLGTVPNGTTIEWFDSATGGTLLGTGSTYITPVLTTTTTFYVTTCPGNYRQAVTVLVGTSINMRISSVPDSICSGYYATLTVYGGISYIWNTGATTSSIRVNPLTTTWYSAKINGVCDSAKDSVTVTVVPILAPVITGTPSKCLGENDTLTASGGLTYLWNDGNTTNTYITGNINADSIISVIVFNSLGCPDTASFTINVVSLSAFITSSKDSTCSGDTVKLSGSGGVTYLWSNLSISSTIIVSPAIQTTYTLYTSNGACKDSATATIGIIKPVTATISSGTDSVCPGTADVISLNVSGGTGTYLWSNGATSSSIMVNDTITTTYTATVSGTCNSVKDTITVKVVPLSKPLINGRVSVCIGEQDTLTVTGGQKFFWSNGSSSNTYITGAIESDSNIYAVAYNSLNCPDSSKFAITLSPSPTVTVTSTTGCKNSSVIILANANGNGPFTYSWSPGGQTGDSITVIDTIHTYTVSVYNGCTSTSTVTVTPDIPDLFVCCNGTIISGDDTILVASGLISYTWIPVSSVTCLTPSCDSVKVSPTVTTTYTVSGQDIFGCDTETMITVNVEVTCLNFTIPNVFTPNFSGQNEKDNIFYIKNSYVDSWSILIYDRWGKEMYNSVNPNSYWSGVTENGDKAPDGVYYYIINASCQGITYKKDGFVQLIR